MCLFIDVYIHIYICICIGIGIGVCINMYVKVERPESLQKCCGDAFRR